MSDNLIKPEDILPEDIRAALRAADLDINPGDMVIGRDGDYYRVARVYWLQGTLTFELQYSHKSDWYHYGDISLDRLRAGEFIKLSDSIETVE